MAEEKKQMYRVVNPEADTRFESKFKDPEEKQYLICIKASAQSGMDDEWDIVTGRTEAYEYIKDRIDYIDFERSFILVESCILSDRKSIYAFMKFAKQYFPNDSFDIDEAIKGDWDEDEYQKNNDIDTSLYGNPKDKLSMEELMGSGIKAVPLD